MGMRGRSGVVEPRLVACVLCVWSVIWSLEVVCEYVLFCGIEMWWWKYAAAVLGVVDPLVGVDVDDVFAHVVVLEVLVGVDWW